MDSNKTMLSGKEHAKLNKRKTFYTKLEKIILNTENEKDLLLPILYQKHLIFPEYHDIVLLLKDLAEEIENVHAESKETAILIPDMDEVYFFKEMAKNNNFNLFKEETLENDDGTLRKGSNGSIADYSYQKAYYLFIQIVNKEESLKILEKEKISPSVYVKPVTTKKIEEKKYIKTFRYPRRRKR